MKAIICNIKQLIPIFIKKPLKRFIKLYLNRTIKLPLLKINDVSEEIKTIKEENVETVFYPKIFDRVLTGRIDLKSPKLSLMKYKDATVFPLSDFIITQGGVVWHKFHNPQFARMIPRDSDLVKIKGNYLNIIKPKNYIRVKIGFFLGGMYSTIWSHFLVQHLPKLYFIPDLRKSVSKNLTIILPKYVDPHIREIVYTYLSKCSGIEILELKDNEVAICDTLFHIEHTAFFMDDMLYTSIGEDVIIPKFVAQSLKNNLLPDLLDNNDEEKDYLKGNKLKLYIGRGSNRRNILNQIEVEEYFKKKGFIFIYPDTLTLHEKVKLFRQATIVVGPGSSGFTNLMFSKPHTKALIFINTIRCFEPYFGFISNYFDIEITMITGNDEPTTGRLSEERDNSYTIPLCKIIEAYEGLDI